MEISPVWKRRIAKEWLIIIGCLIASLVVSLICSTIADDDGLKLFLGFAGIFYSIRLALLLLKLFAISVEWSFKTVRGNSPSETVVIKTKVREESSKLLTLQTFLISFTIIFTGLSYTLWLSVLNKEGAMGMILTGVFTFVIFLCLLVYTAILSKKFQTKKKTFGQCLLWLFVLWIGVGLTLWVLLVAVHNLALSHS